MPFVKGQPRPNGSGRKKAQFSGGIARLHIEYWPVTSLIPYERNPRKNDAAVDRMVASIKEFGFAVPVLARTTGEVVDGHLRLKAALKLHMTEVPVIVCDNWTEAQVKAFRLMVNRSVAWADWDLDALSLEFGELKALKFDLTLTGFDSVEFAGPVGGSPEDLPEDEQPPVPADPVTRRGDLWLCGANRVLCGDATSALDTLRLVGGGRIDIAITDPPYGIGIVKMVKDSEKGVVVGGKPYGSKKGIVGRGGSAGAMYPFGGVGKGVVGGANIVKPTLYAPVINDDSTVTAARFYQCALEYGIEHFIIFGGQYFTAFLPPSPCWCIWDKQNSGNFADVEMAWTSFDKGSKLYSWLWNGLSRAGDRQTELATRVHPTQKPVGLFGKIFADFPFGCCYDGFLGSGSILIACERTGRACYGMELAEPYCDVIVTRWQNLTNREATLEGDGRTFAELKAERSLVAA